VRLAALALLATVALLPGCAVGTQLVASPSDLEAYRAVRTADAWGPRLAAAQRYLEQQPEGRWHGEVEALFSREEAAYFAEAQASRDGVRRYLGTLPRGPHAEAALALLVAYDAKVDDVETARLLRGARETELALAEAAAERKTFDDWMIGVVSLLVNEPEPAAEQVTQLLAGEGDATWGLGRDRGARAFPFAVPTTSGLAPRRAEARLELVRGAGGVVTSAVLEGADLFVRWAEARRLAAWDPGRTEDRASASGEVGEVLSGIFERTLPVGRCSVPGSAGALVSRRCGPLSVEAAMGTGAGTLDRIVVVRSATP
jgi:hypothetical protein